MDQPQTTSPPKQQIQPHFLKLKKVLDERLFRIPQYQRAYSWASRQREDLFGDIRDVLDQDGQRDHFMATLVVLTREVRSIGTEKFSVVDVVDGQQRITTLVILHRAIAKALSDGDTIQRKARSKINDLLVKGDDVSLLLLQTNHDTSNFFVDYVRHGAIPSRRNAETLAERAVADAIADCEKFVAEFDADGLIRLINALWHQLTFILHEVSDERTVYTVFEVLNSRGLPVAWLDRLKSMLMAIAFESGGQHSAETIDELHEIWKCIYRALGLHATSMSEAMRFAAVLKTGKRKRGKLLNSEDAALALRDWCDGKVKRAIEASRWIEQVILTMNQINEDARLNAVTRMSQARFVAVAILLSNYTGSEREMVLKQWETTTFRIFGVARKDARTLSGRLIGLGVEIYKNKISPAEACAKLRQFGREQCPVELIDKHLSDTDRYEGWTTELRYLMYRYEEYLCEKAGEKVDVTTWTKIWNERKDETIEHILPQSKEVSDGKTADGVLVHRLGNLVVLPPGVNSSLSNKSPEEKRIVYKKSPLHCVRELAAHKQWTVTEIKAREDRIIDWLKSILGDTQ